MILLQPQIGAKFKKLDGFFVLGRQLLVRPVTEEIFAVLFCIMLGKRTKQEKETRRCKKQEKSKKVQETRRGRFVFFFFFFLDLRQMLQHSLGTYAEACFARGR